METSFLANVVLPLGMIILVFWWWFHLCHTKKYYKNLPGPPTVPFFGNALDFTSSAVILNTMLKYVKNHGGLVKMQMGPIKRVLLVADYKMLEFILSSTKLLTKSSDYQYLYSWLGSGLLIGSGPKWKKHRKLLTPAFHFQVLENFIETFETCGDKFVQKLLEEVGKTSTDIYPFVTLCSLDIICETTMGISINAQDDIGSEYVKSVKEMCRIIIERAVQPLQMLDLTYMLTRNYHIEKRAIRILHEQANSVINKRYQELQGHTKDDNSETKKKKAFLDLLLEATVDGQPLSKVDIREEVDTFMFAGHDTTASAISFTLFCLANYPDVQQSVFEEQELIFEGDRKPNVKYAHLQSMKYLEQVIKETLRLYPSVPIIGRQPDVDLEYENTCIPKGSTILLFPFGIHRNPDYFKDPLTFDPSRFLNVDGKFPYAYIPFSAGPRNCIGQKFAMLEMKSVISKIIREFKLQPAVPHHDLQLVAETVLKSANGISICLRKREKF
ncbi:hypothetical protein Zmor_014863 [Zophobas morio]|uniref:Cytochrome P450 n=2 Tax=Zophobas morio TaxID=2755281 RepID=A0AA38MGZ1_9CUCU|nr:hypothetical protein Zmor_014863 [Zophobas morio]